MLTPRSRLTIKLLLLSLVAPIEPSFGSPGSSVTDQSAKARSSVRDSVELAVTRLSGSAGEALVANAIPLTPGALRADALAGVRLVVDGEPKEAYFEATTGRHPDGSLRSVLVQFRTFLRPADRLTAWLIIGSSTPGRRLAEPAETPVYPEAVALPDERRVPGSYRPGRGNPHSFRESTHRRGVGEVRARFRVLG